jgi:hypothetical protein
MEGIMKGRLRVLVAVAVLVSAAFSSQANAFGLRVPQVPVLGGSLQGYLNSKGESINVLTDQQDAQVYAHSAAGNGLLPHMVTLSPGSAVDQIGIYNASAAVPPLFFLLSASAGPGAFSTMSFKPGNILVVNRFDSNANFLSQTTYGGVDAGNFGFYISTPSGTYFSQDGRNPGAKAQMLAYQGTGPNAGEWWLCFEDTSVAGGSDQDFDDAVCILESVNPLPVRQATLGAVKALYR